MSRKEDLEREEKRLLIALGFLAILIVFKPSFPAPSVALAVIGVFFYGLLVAWVGYALCMLVYVSDDIFGPSLSRYVHRVGLMLLFAFPIFWLSFAYVLYISATSPNSVSWVALLMAILDTISFFVLGTKIKK